MYIINECVRWGRAGGSPPLQAGRGRQKGHSCVAHRIKKVPQSAAGLVPNASSYSNQSPFPQPNLKNFLASLSLPRCPVTCPSFTLHPFWWQGGDEGQQPHPRPQNFNLHWDLDFRSVTLVWLPLCSKSYSRNGQETIFTQCWDDLLKHWALQKFWG